MAERKAIHGDWEAVARAQVDPIPGAEHLPPAVGRRGARAYLGGRADQRLVFLATAT